MRNVQKFSSFLRQFFLLYNILQMIHTHIHTLLLVKIFEPKMDIAIKEVCFWSDLFIVEQ